LYAFTDVHIGAKAHDEVKFKRALDKLRKDPNGYCFFNGDNLEFIPDGYGISQNEQSLGINEQLDVFIDLLKSLGKKVLFFRTGNHEERAARCCGGIDIGKRISRESGVPMLHVGMEEVHIYIKKQKLRIVTSHGEGGGSKKVHLNMQLSFPGADLYFSGHTHEMYYNEGNLNIDTSSGEEAFRGQVEMVGGSFLNWAEYARGKNMRPTQTGCYVLELDESGVNVRGTIK
jgi:hypothetical protein